MGLFDRVYSLSQRFYNSEPNTIETVSDEIDVGIDYTGGCGEDLVITNPHKITRTILNCRNAATDPQVKGILTDTITKSNNDFEIECDNPEAKAYLEKRCKEWDITQFADDEKISFVNVFEDFSKMDFDACFYSNQFLTEMGQIEIALKFNVLLGGYEYGLFE